MYFLIKPQQMLPKTEFSKVDLAARVVILISSILHLSFPETVANLNGS